MPQPQRPYNYKHRQLRKRLEPQVQSGRATCWRCQRPIAPDDAWDLGHDHNDPTGQTYKGIECRKCNRATYGRERPATNAPICDTSRAW